jgi:hypothetical protein
VGAHEPVRPRDEHGAAEEGVPELPLQLGDRRARPAWHAPAIGTTPRAPTIDLDGWSGVPVFSGASETKQLVTIARRTCREYGQGRA